MPSFEITSAKDLNELVLSIGFSAQRKVRALKEILATESDCLDALRMMMFSPDALHRTEDRPLPLFEQIAQAFNNLATIEAARWVFVNHPEIKGVRLNFGTHQVFDLESLEQSTVAAKVFAANDPCNDRIENYVDHLIEKAPEIPHRYVYFNCPEFKSICRQGKFEKEGVQVWSLLGYQVTAWMP